MASLLRASGAHARRTAGACAAAPTLLPPAACAVAEAPRLAAPGRPRLKVEQVTKQAGLWRAGRPPSAPTTALGGGSGGGKAANLSAAQ